MSFLIADEQTLLCCSIGNYVILQVTTEGMYLSRIEHIRERKRTKLGRQFFCYILFYRNQKYLFYSALFSCAKYVKVIGRDPMEKGFIVQLTVNAILCVLPAERYISFM